MFHGELPAFIGGVPSLLVKRKLNYVTRTVTEQYHQHSISE